MVRTFLASTVPPVATTAKSHKGRNIAIVVIVVILIAIIGLALASSMSGGGSIIPQSHTVNIVNGLVTVNANGYEDYQFSVPSGATSVQVSGTFTASGGSGNDIKVYVMDSTNFVNWENGHQASTYYNSGQVTTGTISASGLTAGTYYLVYDNTYSILSQKNVQTNVNLVYTS